MQKNIFELKDFPSSMDSLDESFAFKINDSKYKDRKKVFLSHKHSDLDKIGGVIDFFEKTYGVKCYIDANDKNMPSTTNRKTAEILKDTIKKADKFILIATEDAISSKWCNWELGLGEPLNMIVKKLQYSFLRIVKLMNKNIMAMNTCHYILILNIEMALQNIKMEKLLKKDIMLEPKKLIIYVF